jgi:hypothetical protein
MVVLLLGSVPGLTLLFPKVSRWTWTAVGPAEAIARWCACKSRLAGAGRPSVWFWVANYSVGLRRTTMHTADPIWM